MKISKIFHTLYGFLMCLPIISILFVCVYVSLNPNAKDSYSGTEIQYRQVEYQTNDVNSFDDLVVGNVYSFEIPIDYTSNWSNDLLADIGFDQELIFIHVPTSSSFRCEFPSDLSSIITTDYFSLVKFDFLGFDYSSNSHNISFTFDNTDDDNTFLFVYDVTLEDFIVSIYFIWRGAANLPDGLNIQYLVDADLSLIPPQYEEVEVQKLDNAFYFSVNEINDNPLFSWAQNSFLVAPITYVVSLFGMTNSSPIVTMLSYWLTISIIWLVFDLIMYIPLLVHRWIDKGVVE